MPRTLSFGTLILAAAVLIAQPIGAQSPAARTQILGLAAKGATDETWAAWNALPAGPEKLRLGVDAAVALKDVTRGVALYDQLATSIQAPDTMRLRALALAAASELMAGRDADAGLTACSAALRLTPTHRPCRDALERMANLGKSIGEQMLGAYALADAGLRPFPGLFTTLESNMTAATRLNFVNRFPHLPAAERLSLIRPVVDGKDDMMRYQAVSALGDIPLPDAIAVLRNVEPSPPPVRQARLVALGQQGDRASLDALAALLDNLDDYLKIPASLALARTGDVHASSVLDGLRRSPIDLQRILAADAATRLNPTAGQDTILDSLTNGSPAVRSLALGAAGRAGLGTHAAVYTRLVGGEPDTRAAAVAAIAETLTAPGRPAAAPQSAPPPRP